MVKQYEEERRTLKNRLNEVKEKKSERNDYNWYSLLAQYRDLQDQGMLPENETWDKWRKKQLSQLNKAIVNNKCGPDQEWVASFRKSDGTYVEGYCRKKTYKSSEDAMHAALIRHK